MRVRRNLELRPASIPGRSSLKQRGIRRTEAHFVGPIGGRLFRRSWEPPEPQRIAVLVHGYAEHSGRYEHVGSTLADAGCAVHAYDQQGHGRSEGRPCHVRRFADFLDDLDAVVALVRSEHAPMPVFVIGHSMGGLVVASWARERQPDVAGVATSGAALALSEDLSGGRLLVARLLRRVAPRLSISSDLDPDALSRDPEVVRAYLEDPLVHRTMTTSFAAEMLDAVARTAGGGADVRVPMLLLHGEDDPLCPVQGSRAFYERLNVEPRGLRTYPGLRHEIFNEPERDAVLGDLIEWIRASEPAVAAT